MPECVSPSLRKLLALGIFLSFCGPLSTLAEQAVENAAPQQEPAVDSKNSQETLTKEESKYFEDFEVGAGDTHGLSPKEAAALQKEISASPVFKNRFLGVVTWQNPSDAWVMMELIYDVKPDLIVETGTFLGGSANLWAVILEQVKPDGKVITIDIEDQRPKLAKNAPIAKEHVQFLLGSSTDPDVVETVRQAAEGKRVLVMLDSLHSKEHVLAELEAYGPLVDVGSYIVVQDTLVGPGRAIEEFLAKNDGFVVDHERDRYPDTVAAGGYLKRIKE